MAINTLWGSSQQVARIAPGLLWVSTASHGGCRVNAARAATMPAALLAVGEQRGGFYWFEEDCAWAAACLAFPEDFKAWRADSETHALNTLRNWYPDAFEALFCRTLEPGESMVKDDRAFEAANIDNPVVCSASGDWHPAVPKGFVGVCARVASTKVETYWLIPADEYAARKRSFVVDPTRHQRIEAF